MEAIQLFNFQIKIWKFSDKKHYLKYNIEERGLLPDAASYLKIEEALHNSYTEVLFTGIRNLRMFTICESISKLIHQATNSISHD